MAYIPPATDRNSFRRTPGGMIEEDEDFTRRFGPMGPRRQQFDTPGGSSVRDRIGSFSPDSDRRFGRSTRPGTTSGGGQSSTGEPPPGFGELGSLSEILEGTFGPLLQERRKQLQQTEQALLDRIGSDPVQMEQANISNANLGRIRGELQNIGGAIAEDLFRPGGAVEQQTSQALRATSESGFGPTSGGFDRARQNILGQARERVTNQIAQRGAQLAQTAVQENLGLTDASIRQNLGSARIEQEGDLARLGALGDVRRQNLAVTNDLAQSLFGGQASIEQLGLAREQMGMNQQILDEFLSRSRQESGCGVGDRIGGTIQGAGAGAAAGSFFPGPGTVVGGIVGGIGGLFSGC